MVAEGFELGLQYLNMDLRRINLLEKGLYRPKTINQEDESCM